ncbi:MAG: nucleotidyltransferase domain-containing protein [Caldilineales bacterium]|nr:nucleotidyltransferase domain-containing protein [Caldilineales bacterium]
MSTPTVAELNERYADYIAAWRQREREHQQRIQARAQSALSVVGACVQTLADSFAVRRVWLFGSLLHPADARHDTDIDLAVEGLDSALYFKALHALYTQLPEGIDLDLITIETAQPSLRQHILATGALLYEHN